MFEEAIAELESMGIPYAENEDGSMVIDISDADKTDVVTIVAFLNDYGLTYSITADSIQVDSVGGLEEEMDTEEEEASMPALDAAMEGMY